MNRTKLLLIPAILITTVFASLFFYDDVKKKTFRTNPADSGSTNYQGYASTSREQQLFLLNGAALSNGTSTTASVSNFGYRASDYQGALSASALNALTTWTTMPGSRLLALPVTGLNYGSNTIFVRFRFGDGAISTAQQVAVYYGIRTPPAVTVTGTPTTNFNTNAPATFTLLTTYPFGYWQTNGAAWVSFTSNTSVTLSLSAATTTNTLYYFGADNALNVALNVSATNSLQVITALTGVVSPAVALNGGAPSPSTNVPVTLSAANANRVRLATNVTGLASAAWAPFVASTNWLFVAGSNPTVWLVAEFSNTNYGFVATNSNSLATAPVGNYTFDNTPMLLNTNVTVTAMGGSNATWYSWKYNATALPASTGVTNLVVLTNIPLGLPWQVATNSVTLFASNDWGYSQSNVRYLATWMVLGSNNNKWNHWGRFTPVSANNRIYGFCGQTNSTTGNFVFSTSDGVNWTTEPTAPWSGSQNPVILQQNGYWWAQGTFTGTGYDTRTFRTLDFTNWTYVQTNTTGAFGRMSKGWVALGNTVYSIHGFTSQTSGVNDVWSSSDATSWSLATNATPFAWRDGFACLAFSNRIWVMGGSTNNRTNMLNDVWSSLDGANWTLATASAPWGIREGITTIVYSNRMWVLGGNTNQAGLRINDVWSSADGSTWTSHSNAGWSGRESAGVGFLSNRMVIWGGDYSTGSEVWWAP